MRRRSNRDIAKGYLHSLELNPSPEFVVMFAHTTVRQARIADPSINSIGDMQQWVKDLPFEVDPDPELDELVEALQTNQA
jgi:hypothetical protein